MNNNKIEVADTQETNVRRASEMFGSNLSSNVFPI